MLNKFLRSLVYVKSAYSLLVVFLNLFISEILEIDPYLAKEVLNHE